MIVLSLFDGMSCGHQALDRASIKVDQYYASEVDKYAIKVTMDNYPNTVQLGSVVDVDVSALPKINLLIGGSPCQSFSFAGKRKGMSTKDEQEILTLDHYLKLKADGYEFEGQSYLFWEYMRILTDIKKYNPDVLFLLENVMMGERWEKVLSKAIGVNPIMINSSLVSAQNRQRLYWTNIGLKPSGLFGYLESSIEQPKDKEILLKDILESDVDDKYFLSDKLLESFNKHKERHIQKGTGFIFSPKSGDDKGSCLRANAALCPTDNTIIVHNTMPRSSKSGKGGTGHLTRSDGKTYCLDTGSTNAIEIKQNNVSYVGLKEVRTESAKKVRRETGTNKKRDKELIERQDGKVGTIMTSLCNDNLIKERKVYQLSTYNRSNGGSQPFQQDRVYDIFGISPSLQAQLPGGSHMINTSRIRRLTPVECERLQTVADGYTASVSDSQRYKMLGNGWTVDVIAHIFNYINK